MPERDANQLAADVRRGIQWNDRGLSLPALDALVALVGTLQRERERLGERVDAEVARAELRLDRAVAAETQVAALTQERDSAEEALQILAADHYFARAEAAEAALAASSETNRQLQEQLADTRRALETVRGWLWDEAERDAPPHGWKAREELIAMADRALAAAGSASQTKDSGLGRDEHGGQFEGEAPDPRCTCSQPQGGSAYCYLCRALARDDQIYWAAGGQSSDPRPESNQKDS